MRYVLASSDAMVNKALTQTELTCISRVKTSHGLDLRIQPLTGTGTYSVIPGACNLFPGHIKMDAS
jgi:hypothetical protein